MFNESTGENCICIIKNNGLKNKWPMQKPVGTTMKCTLPVLAMTLMAKAAPAARKVPDIAMPVPMRSLITVSFRSYTPKGFCIITIPKNAMKAANQSK